jgi:hypothetical protein
MKDKAISKFCQETEKILQSNLYGIVLDIDSRDENVYVWVVPKTMEERDIKFLKDLKENIENKYKAKLDVIYIPPKEFTEVISYFANGIDLCTLLEKLKVYTSKSIFYRAFINSLLSPTETSSVKIDSYKI